MQLSRLEKLCLDQDRRTLADLGLSIGSITLKYWSCVRLSSQLDGGVSYFFYHCHAARHGKTALYKSLNRLGWVWSGGNWLKK